MNRYIHSYTDDQGEECIAYFHYHSDLSGQVIISLPDREPFTVPGSALLSFIANYVEGRRIAHIEDMDDYELLGITPGPA